MWMGKLLARISSSASALLKAHLHATLVGDWFLRSLPLSILLVLCWFWRLRAVPASTEILVIRRAGQKLTIILVMRQLTGLTHWTPARLISMPRCCCFCISGTTLSVINGGLIFFWLASLSPRYRFQQHQFGHSCGAAFAVIQNDGGVDDDGVLSAALLLPTTAAFPPA